MLVINAGMTEKTTNVRQAGKSLSILTRTLAGIFVLGLALLTSGSASAAITDWQRGVAINPTWEGDFGSESFRESLRRAAGMNLNYVTFTVPFVQSNIYSTDIRRYEKTPTDESLGAAIDYAHSLGLKVNLLPHLNPLDDKWRIYINPDDRETWFRNYENTILLPVAALAERHGADMYTIGIELGGMASPASNPDNSRHWREMISKVRGTYGGPLTYSAQHGNPDEKGSIDWWDALDYIGVSAYHPSGIAEEDPSLERRVQAWRDWWNNELEPLSKRYGKDIIFTEIGFRSIPNAHKEPAAWDWGGAYDPEEQVRNFEALFSAFRDNPNFRGVHIWEWKSDPNAGGEGNTDFTPQGKPAEGSIRWWFDQ